MVSTRKSNYFHFFLLSFVLSVNPDPLIKLANACYVYEMKLKSFARPKVVQRWCVASRSPRPARDVPHSPPQAVEQSCADGFVNHKQNKSQTKRRSSACSRTRWTSTSLLGFRLMRFKHSADVNAIGCNIVEENSEESARRWRNSWKTHERSGCFCLTLTASRNSLMFAFVCCPAADLRRES